MAKTVKQIADGLGIKRQTLRQRLRCSPELMRVIAEYSDSFETVTAVTPCDMTVYK